MENGAGNKKKMMNSLKGTIDPLQLPALKNVFEKLFASQLDQLYSEILSITRHGV